MFLLLAIVILILAAGVFQQSVLGGLFVMLIGFGFAWASENFQRFEEKTIGLFFFVGLVAMVGGIVAGLWSVFS